MKQITLRWRLVLVATLVITNVGAYHYGVHCSTVQSTLHDKEEEEYGFDDEDVVIIIARPEANSQGDARDEMIFRAHITQKQAHYMCVGKGNLLKYRGHIFSRKPLGRGEQMFIPFLQ